MVATHIIRTLHSFRFSQIREFPLCACNPKHVYSRMWVYCSELPSPLLGSPLLISHFEGLTWVNFPWPGLCFDCISLSCRSMWCDAISVMADLSGNKLVRLHRHVVVSLIMVFSECVQCNLTMTPEMRTPINSCSLNAIPLAYIIYIYIYQLEFSWLDQLLSTKTGNKSALYKLCFFPDKQWLLDNVHTLNL